jgi:hypothetical protein
MDGRMSEGQRRYVSYLLRLWQVASQGRLVWRASLEEARTGQRRGFPDLEALFAFLSEETAAGRGEDAREDLS